MFASCFRRDFVIVIILLLESLASLSSAFPVGRKEKVWRSGQKYKFESCNRSCVILHVKRRADEASSWATGFHLPFRVQKSDPFRGSFQTQAGFILAIAIIIGLASTTDFSTEDLGSDVDEILMLQGLAKGTVTNVITTTVPQSSTDVVAISLGEAIAGVIGAITTAALKATASAVRANPKPLITEAIANSDYFIANSASLPLLEALGLPPALASLFSVVVAAVPSELIKLNTQRREQQLQEELLLRRLLDEQQTQEGVRNGIIKTNKQKPESQVDPGNLIPVLERKVDFVEVFSDVTRWLSYDVLKKDFGDVFEMYGLEPSLNGAVWGFCAAISSQLYADVLYLRFRFGPQDKQIEVRSRNAGDWVACYASRGLSNAALFGVYELSQGPISRWIQGILSGGFEGCLGSKSFDACMQTYIDANAPGPSPEAQLRALVTNLAMVVERLQDVAGDTTPEDYRALISAWAVSAYSYFSHFINIPFFFVPEI